MRIFRFALVWCLFAFSVPAHAFADPYLITVNFTTFTLTLTDEMGAELAQYPVALPKSSANPPLPTDGVVTRAEKYPSWTPTPSTRAAMAKQGKHLAAHYPPRHPKNAMGSGKISITYSTPRTPSTIRIHGTIDPSSIGKRASRGCIRMHNRDILALIDHIRGHETRVRYTQ